MPDILLQGDHLSDLEDGIRYSDNLPVDFLSTPHEASKILDGVRVGGAKATSGAAIAGMHRTPMSHFAMLGEHEDKLLSESGSVVLSLRSAEDKEQLPEPPARASASCVHNALLRAVSVIIPLCLALYILTLLISCSSFYQQDIQPWILAGLEPYLQSYQSREDAAAFVFLLCGGMFPTLLAYVLWNSVKRHKQASAVCHWAKLSRPLRQKPSIPRLALCVSQGRKTSASSTLYIDASWGDILFLLLILTILTALFIVTLAAEDISSISSPSSVLRAMGKGFGYMSLFTLVGLLLLANKVCFWAEVFQLPHATAAKYRRWIGTLTLFFSAAHCVCHAVNFSLRDEFVSQLVPHFGAMYQDTPIRDSNGINAFGEVALVAMAIMGVTAVPVFRKRWHTIYACSQQVFGSIAILAICVHFPRALWWFLPALVMAIAQKVVAGSHSRFPVEIVDMAPLPSGVTRLVCRRAKQDNEPRAAFSPGQFVFLNASRISWVEWHPFYVASSPSSHEDTFKLYVQGRGDWTESFFDLSKLAYATQEAPLLFVDGYYGDPLPALHERYESLVLAADGIGITGVIAMLEELFTEAKRSQLQGGQSGGEPLSTGARKVWLAWICNDVFLLKEFESLLADIRAFDPTELRFHVRLFLTKTPTAQELEYTPPASCDFHVPQEVRKQREDENRKAKETTQRRHPSSVVTQDNESSRMHAQNRSCCMRFRSRPFRAAAANPAVRVLVLLAAFSTTLVLAVQVEWQDHQHGSGVFGGEATEREGMFRPMHRVACVCVVLAGCFSAYFVLGCEEVGMAIANMKSRASDSPWKCHSRRRTCATDCEPVTMCTEATVTSTSCTTPWVDMTPCGAQSSFQSDCQSPKSGDVSSSESGALSVISEGGNLARSKLRTPSLPNIPATTTNILEKLKVKTRQPDLSAFMLEVARRSPTESIGVIACGGGAFVKACDTAVSKTGEKDPASAAWSFHAMKT